MDTRGKKVNRLVIQALLATMTVTGIFGANRSNARSEDSAPEHVKVKIRAKAITNRDAFVYYYLSKTGNHPFFIQKYVNEVAKIAVSLGPGQSVTLNAAFAPGRETRANTITLTYGEAQQMAQVRSSKKSEVKYTCTWEPTFDLTSET